MEHKEFRSLMEYMGLNEQFLSKYIINPATEKPHNIRTIRRWKNGELKIPDGVDKKMYVLLDYFHTSIDKKIDETPDNYNREKNTIPTNDIFPDRWHRHISIHVQYIRL